jgi:hypothetical protein
LIIQRIKRAETWHKPEVNVNRESDNPSAIKSHMFIKQFSAVTVRASDIIKSYRMHFVAKGWRRGPRRSCSSTKAQDVVIGVRALKAAS